ncbi:MAG: ABC transporter substrate-binding protein [Ilumatobacteraceae bacterium]
MQAASASGASGDGGNRQLKRWGPVIGVLVVALIGGGVLLATRDGDDEADGGSDTTAVTETSSAIETTTPDSGVTDTTGPAEITFPMSWSQAKELGLTDQIEWGERCDTTTGRIAVPDFFRSECFAPFTGDNGGATATGVTGDEITVVYYEGPNADPVISYVTDAIAVDDTNAQQFETMKNIVRYYETYYELYGRKINLVTFEGTGIATDEVAARADAAAIVQQYKPFAVLGGPSLTSAFADELAKNKTLCIGCTPGQPASFYDERDPYVWGLDGSALQKQTHVLEFIGKQLVGKNAEHAGDALTSTPRTFGLVYLESSGASKDLADSFAKGMSDLGSPLAEVVPYQLDPATIQQQASQVITKLKAAGVTSVIFSGDPVAPRDFTKEATAQEYFPEWIVAASTLVDVTAFARTYDQQQWAHAFGVTQLAARGVPEKSGSYADYVWFNGTPPPADDSIGVIAPNPALLFAVLQGVGPNLSPETFRDRLFAADPTTRNAISQPSLSYGDKGLWGGEKDYQGVDDATVFWWNPTATGPDEIRRQGTGMYMYVDGGTRYLPGEWTTDEKLFNPDGAVAIYETPPPGEERGDFPSPAG